MSSNTADCVGVIGAGTMGSGVAQALAATGHEVVLVDVSEERLSGAERAIRRGLRTSMLLAKGDRPEPAERVLDRIRFCTDLERVEAATFVIENVTERWDVKKPVYERLDVVCPPHVPFAVNTSATSITRVGSLTRRASRVIGMHFMNPVPLMPMVEVIRGFHTSADTVERARALLAGMGKSCIVVNDAPGFVTNRVMMLTVNEAVFLVHEGVAPVEDVDRLFKTCFGHRMGPLETADLIGLDTVLDSLRVIFDGFHDDKYRPCPLLVKMVDAGLLGRKSGEGFYRYRQTSKQEGDRS
jgi:3-hydroxybutyryl-CoA dehydrogenase